MAKEINMNQSQDQQVQINPNDLEDITCDNCKSQCFEQTFLFKRSYQRDVFTKAITTST